MGIHRSSSLSVKGIRRIAAVFDYSVLIVAAVVAIFPFFWMLSSALRPQAEIFRKNISLFPPTPTLQNFVTVWNVTQFKAFLFNSILVAVTTTLIVVAISVLAGYALSRFRFRGRDFFGQAILVVEMLPGVLLVIPLFMIFKNLRLVDTRLSLIIAYTTFSLPFSIWMLRGYFDSIPAALEEAAMIDGCSRMGALWRVIIPVMGPGIAAVAINSFLLSWNEFLFALTLIQTDSLRTLPVGITTFMQQHYNRWDLLFAASTLASIPVLVLFFLLQKHMVRGLTAGAVKG